MPAREVQDFEAVIGLEVHAQLATRTKIFCGCSTAYGAAPNSQTCPVCLGHPGALPVLNRRAVELGATAALALGCEVHDGSLFSRKNYFYPDLPKGYQISQYDRPLATGGAVPIEIAGVPKAVALTRLHLEEDAGKSIHDAADDADPFSHVDLNRAGVPLAEIVSQPDLRTPEEAYLFLQRLRSILRYCGVCDGNLEEGSLRCDANVSIRESAHAPLGTRTELKNLNSFRNVRRALEYEIERQMRLVGSGGKVVQQTVLWDAEAGVTRPMRGKEEAHDYRYFPEPDLPPVAVDRAWIEATRCALPELPHARKQRLIERHGLRDVEGHALSLEAPLADYFEEVARLCGNAKAAANFVLNDVQRVQNAAGRDETDIPLPAPSLAELIQLVDRGTISATVARRDILDELFAGRRSAIEIVRDRGLEQLSDESELEGAVRAVIDANPGQVEQYRAGKTGLLGFFVGKVMRATAGKANPSKVNELLKRHLGNPSVFP